MFEDTIGAQAVLFVEFDGNPSVSGFPNWTYNGGSGMVAGVVFWKTGNTVGIGFDTTFPVQVIVPSGATGVNSSDGGAVVPGTYDVS